MIMLTEVRDEFSSGGVYEVSKIEGEVLVELWSHRYSEKCRVIGSKRLVDKCSIRCRENARVG